MFKQNTPLRHQRWLPITGLQHKYESLGITIHNAFGVIEAPLITLNRLGKNEPGSMGDLMPETWKLAFAP